MDLAPGTKIADRYVIERALAKGGMGAVYVAMDERMQARVALKITAAGGAAADQVAKRFAREAQIGHRLGSRRQGFVRASDWGRVDAVQLYLVMDLVQDARPLELRTGTREERLARWRCAAELVQIAHEQGVVHRDLKPANFLQAPDGTISLTDFGLAKVVGEAAEAESEDESLTMTGMGFGTPPYMPPEQLEDAKHADQRADVFALGCMLFEALVARLPYEGKTLRAVISAHHGVQVGTLPLPSLRRVDPTVSRSLDDVCRHALELGAAERTPSVSALLAELRLAAESDRLESEKPASIGRLPTGAVSAPTWTGEVDLDDPELGGTLEELDDALGDFGDSEPERAFGAGTSVREADEIDIDDPDLGGSLEDLDALLGTGNVHMTEVEVEEVADLKEVPGESLQEGSG